jgi:hypothetical protein
MLIETVLPTVHQAEIRVPSPGIIVYMKHSVTYKCLRWHKEQFF